MDTVSDLPDDSQPSAVAPDEQGAVVEDAAPAPDGEGDNTPSVEAEEKQWQRPLIPNDQLRQAQLDIARQLNETYRAALYRIRGIILHFKIEGAYSLLQEVLEIEANGGMMTRDGSRRRTVGGVFFQLAFDRMDEPKSSNIKGNSKRRKKRDKQPEKVIVQAAEPIPPEPSPPPLAWEDRLPVLAMLFEQMGEVTTVKITLVGRPGQVEVRGNMVVTAMKHEAKPVTLPSGLPPLPQTKTMYTVYISKKQWKKVEGDLAADPEDKLIVEGVGVLDSEAKAMALFATGVKSMAAEKKKHPPKNANDAPKEAAPSESPVVEASAAPPPQPKPEKASRFTEDTVAAPTVLSVVEATTNMPPDVVEKLNGLRATGKMYQQKVEALESKPEGQRFGLDMTRKLLKKVEDDIATLEQQYR